MTDRDLLQQMIDRIGKEPRAVKFDDDDTPGRTEPGWA